MICDVRYLNLNVNKECMKSDVANGDVTRNIV